MKQGANKEERLTQREILQTLYSDYKPTRHDLFVERYNKELDRRATQEYMTNRGIN